MRIFPTAAFTKLLNDEPAVGDVIELHEDGELTVVGVRDSVALLSAAILPTNGGRRFKMPAPYVDCCPCA